MAPGILDSLSELFTDRKPSAEGWSADVEIVDPAAPAGKGTEMKLVPRQGVEAAAAASPALPAPLPTPVGNGPDAWTTTVEMKTETGDPMVLGVSKTPVPETAPPRQVADAAPPSPAPAPPTPSAAPAKAEDPLAGLRAAEKEVAARRAADPLGDLPAAESGDLPAAAGDLPPAEGDLPPAEGDLPAAEGDLPPLEGDDLPPAEGESAEGAPKAAAKPAPRPVRKPPAKLPYSDPLRAPDPVAKRKPAATPERSLSRVGELKTGPTYPSANRDKLRLSREEKLATAKEPRYPTPGEVAAKQQGMAPTRWPVTKLAKNDAKPPRRDRPRPAMLSRTSLSGVTFALGESVNLENSLPPDGGIDTINQCVKKNRGTTLFCVEPIDWPDALKAKFVVPTILYTGPMAIVRYDQGSASRLHALFPSAEFSTVIDYYQKRYGDPTEIWKRSIAPLAEPRRDNPTVAWRSRDPKTNAVTILEIRQFDDTRGGFPDTNRGAVMLYLANSPSIFPQVSSHELMRLKREGQKKEG